MKGEEKRLRSDPGSEFRLGRRRNKNCEDNGRPVSLMRTHTVLRAIGVSHTACKDEFRRNIQSHRNNTGMILVPREYFHIWRVFL